MVMVLKLALFSFLFIFTFPRISCLKQHPLDPFSPSEIKLVQTIVKKSYPSSNHYNLTFQYVGLDDPDKQTVLSWQSKSSKTPPRRASVITRFNKQTHEIIVDLSKRSLVSKKVYQGHGYPTLSVDEQTLANELALKYEPFVKSVESRRLNLSHVFCSGFTVGWYGEGKGNRTLKLSCFYTNDTVNLFVRPLEGITVVVDLDEMKIVEYFDRFEVPMPKGEGTEFRLSKQRPPFGPRLNGVAMVEPEGPGFKINGHEVR